MKVMLKKASNSKFEKLITITTLNDLCKLHQQYECPFILFFSNDKIEDITIYDAYIE